MKNVEENVDAAAAAEKNKNNVGEVKDWEPEFEKDLVAKNVSSITHEKDAKTGKTREILKNIEEVSYADSALKKRETADERQTDKEWSDREDKIKKYEDKKKAEDDNYKKQMAKKKAKVAKAESDVGAWALGAGYAAIFVMLASMSLLAVVGYNAVMGGSSSSGKDGPNEEL